VRTSQEAEDSDAQNEDLTLDPLSDDDLPAATAVGESNPLSTSAAAAGSPGPTVAVKIGRRSHPVIQVTAGSGAGGSGGTLLPKKKLKPKRPTAKRKVAKGGALPNGKHARCALNSWLADVSDLQVVDRPFCCRAGKRRLQRSQGPSGRDQRRQPRHEVHST
jgi:hypothetical protein